MKKSKWIAIIAIVALAAAAVPLAYARGEHRFGKHGELGEGSMFFGVLRHVKNELDITSEQQTQLREIAKEVHEQNKQYRQSMHSGFRDVARLLIAEPDNVDGAEALLDQQAAARKEMRANALRGVSRALKVLTPEQRYKLGEMIEKRASHF